MDRAHLVFLKVAEVGNITAASRALHIAQPSLTRTISKLEESFGTPLFTRLPRGMELTPAGEALLRHLKTMRIIYQRAQVDVEAVRKGYVDTVRIGSGLIYQVLMMPTILQRMWKRFPKTSFQVVTGSASKHRQLLLDGKLDIAVSAAMPETSDIDLQTTLLGQINYGVVHRPGTLPNIPSDQLMPLDQLTEHNWVVFEMSPELSANLNQRFFDLGLPPPRVALTTTSLQLGLEVVQSQGLIMPAPTILKEHLGRQGILVHSTTEPIWQHDSGITVHATNADHPVLQALTEEIEDYTQNMPEFSLLR